MRKSSENPASSGSKKSMSKNNTQSTHQTATKGKKPSQKKTSREITNATTSTIDPRFEAIKRVLLGKSGVELGSMFGSEGLKIGGKVFAMLVKDQLVVKLPAARVQKIVDEESGKFFDPGHGRLMKEWVAVHSGTGITWTKLAHEAKDFVAQNSPRRKTK